MYKNETLLFEANNVQDDGRELTVVNGFGRF